MKITIVSVAFNEEKNIRRTIESVLNQTSNDIEYIICDGQSTDKTVDIARTYKNAFDDKGITYIINSERDLGIYDAMNKGIRMAEGEYIFFLNAGDWFYSNDIIEKIIKVAQGCKKPDFIYGGVATISRNVIKVVFGDDESLINGMSIPHQALFSKTVYMKENLFDLQYRISADYNFLLGQKLLNRIFYRIDLKIAYFSADGLSSKDMLTLIEESEKIKSKYGIKTNKKKARIKAYKEQLIIKIKSKIPQKIWELWSIKYKNKEIYVWKG